MSNDNNDHNDHNDHNDNNDNNDNHIYIHIHIITYSLPLPGAPPSGLGLASLRAHGASRCPSLARAREEPPGRRARARIDGSRPSVRLDDGRPSPPRALFFQQAMPMRAKAHSRQCDAVCSPNWCCGWLAEHLQICLAWFARLAFSRSSAPCASTRWLGSFGESPCRRRASCMLRYVHIYNIYIYIYRER